jgi:DUF1009 family protein
VSVAAVNLKSEIRNHKSFGLLAGWGRFPIVVAEALKRQGYRVCCLGIAGHADEPKLTAICDSYASIGIAKLGRQIRYFQRHGVTSATMAGKVFKTLLFERRAWRTHLPDLTTARILIPHFIMRWKPSNDDALLLAVIAAYARGGIHFAPATNFAPELLVNTSHLGGPSLSFGQRKDIAFGFALAKEMGRLDVGQSVAVKGRAVLAVEAVEGTDECIRRAGRLCTSGGFTVVKVAKPQQDMRFDVPTIGVGTLEVLAASGGKVLAIESGKTIVIDRDEVAAFASRHRISVVAVDSESLQETLGAAA